jgi:argininosuccinate lyase
MQLDKPPLFESIDAVKDILDIFTAFFANIAVKGKEIAEKVGDESLFSVDIVEYLIKKGVSYRKAHDIVGRMVRDCLDKGTKISSLSEAELKVYSPQLKPDVKKILNAWASVNLKRSFGSTNPKLVRRQLASWKKRLS